MAANEKPVEKKAQRKRTMAIFMRLWRYLSRYRWMIVLALLLTLISNLLALVGPMLSGRAIDAIEPGRGAVDFKQVFLNCALMVAFYFASSLLSYILSILMTHLSQRVVFAMRADVFNKLLDLPVGFFDATQTGDIISRISYDIDTVNATLSNDLLQICTSVIVVGGSFAMMLMISPLMTTIFFVTVPVSIIFIKYMTGKVRPLFRRRSAKLGELNGYVEEIITGQKTIKAYHQEETMIQRFSERNTEAVDAYYEADYYGSMVGPSVNFINNFSLSMISVFGALLFLFGRITLGNMSSFILYSRKFSGPINEAANILSELQSAFAAAERVFRLIDQEPEKEDVEGAHVYEDVRGEVEMQNVTFGYSQDKIVLENLSLHAKPGSLVAIVGHTGAGKTTLINLLMRFYDPNSGVIALDGVDIEQATRRSLRLAYAMVLQDTWLFSGTVFDNIAYGKEGATLEDVTAAAKAAKMHTFITQLPSGYDTVINEDGLNISQGQKQLLTIARAMLLDAQMLILDEATSNVDTRTE
ncbi:MAG: ABC transporter ATP-binding protein/permease, partial [Oscillospiraceae bacterium]|nr:ABC transporter ATP-binding protein/permease [Oscillospiraceae bacterium]